MKRFLAYEEYAAKYEMMAQQLASTYKDVGSRETIERGIEVLARTLESQDGRTDHGKKGLTFQDLLIKVSQLRTRSRALNDTCVSRYNVCAGILYFLVICSSTL